jgi:hypothetical protein
VSQDLDCRIGAVVIGRHTELCADIVSSGGCIVPSKNHISEVSALLGHVQDEISGLEVSLKNREVEDCLSSRQVDQHGGVNTSFCECSSSKHCQRFDRGDIYCGLSIQRENSTILIGRQVQLIR